MENDKYVDNEIYRILCICVKIWILYNMFIKWSLDTCSLLYCTSNFVIAINVFG